MDGNSLGQIVFGVILSMAIALGIAATWNNAGMKDGYFLGYSDAKANICNTDYLKCPK